MGAIVCQYVIIATLLRYQEIELFEDWASATGAYSWSFALIGCVIVCSIVGPLFAFIVGVPVGALVGACVEPFLPKPPDDGYVASRD